MKNDLTVSDLRGQINLSLNENDLQKLYELELVERIEISHQEIIEGKIISQDKTKLYF